MNWYQSIKFAIFNDKRWTDLPDHNINNEKSFVQSFQVADTTYTFEANIYNGSWFIIFYMVNQKDNTVHFKKTNKRQSLQVMSGVMNAFKNFLTSKEPRFFNFSASHNEPTRISLYRNMMKRYAEQFGYGHYEREGNTIFVKKNGLETNQPSTYFEAYKKNPDGSEPFYAPTDQELAGNPLRPDDVADPKLKQIKNRLKANNQF